jgi:hypothetical protein
MPLKPSEQDVVLAGGLIASPAWAGWLAEINEVLTTFSLVVGLALGAFRLWSALKNRRRER